jgi:hypothetical protein
MKTIIIRLCAALAVTVSVAETAICSDAATPAGDNAAAVLYVLPDGVETRWASPENFVAERSAAGKANAGRKGSANFPLKTGQSKVLAEVQGKSGMVRRMWMTIDDRKPDMLRGLRLDIYWDGADKPAVSAPMGDFFCHGLGRMSTFETALLSSPEGRSFNCCVPMPFKSGMKIVVTNETEHGLWALFLDVDYTVGDRFSDDVMYFHSYWRRENPTTLKRDYELLPRVEGTGRFLGVNVGVAANKELYFNSWWGEGEVKIYVDGDTEWPTLCGTGTEDYIGTGWGQGQYSHAYQGCHLADAEKMQYCFYRLHIPDPVYFSRDIRATIQQIGAADSGTFDKFKARRQKMYKTGEDLVEIDWDTQKEVPLFERQDDWSCCAYFYLDKPVNNLPALAPVEERIAGL